MRKIREILHSRKKGKGYILVSIIVFIPIVAVFTYVIVDIASQNVRTVLDQEAIRQAQLASITAMDYAKEQYELNQSYSGTPETELYTNGIYRVTYEVVSLGFTNPTNTQQDIRGIGRVYRGSDAKPSQEREIQGKITYTSGVPESVRFIFIVDNSSSMNETEWLQSKETVDAAAEFILDNAPTAQIGIVQYGTNHYTREHKYDVTVPFTKDKDAATNWDRRYGPGSPSTSDIQDHLPASLARMRIDSVYGPGDELDLVGATNIQYVLFTDAHGINFSGNFSSCCSALKKVSSEPSSWFNNNGAGFSVLSGFGEYNVLKNGTVFEGDGYTGLTSQWTVLSINQNAGTPEISAALASVGGSWSGGIDSNPDDPEGDSILPRKFISSSLSAGPDEIISLLQEILDAEINI